MVHNSCQKSKEQKIVILVLGKFYRWRRNKYKRHTVLFVHFVQGGRAGRHNKVAYGLVMIDTRRQTGERGIFKKIFNFKLLPVHGVVNVIYEMRLVYGTVRWIWDGI
jgi:hypothetical protein